jgi:predicted alpha/beta hydrolase
MSASNVAVLHDFYESAKRDMRRLSPQDVGAARIGHFGFFREDPGHRLWPQMLDWLNAVT